MTLQKLHDFTKFKVESGIEIPQRESNSSRMRALLEGMDYGDSVKLPADLINVAKLVTAADEDSYAIRDIKDKHGAVTHFRIYKLDLGEK